MRKLSRGEKVAIAHQDYNRWQEAGAREAMMKLGSIPGLSDNDSSHEGIILVKNTLPRRLKRYSVLGLRGTIPNPLLSSQQSTDFQDRIALKGETPSSVTTGRFCVIQTDAEIGEVVPALVSGVTPVRLSVGNITDEFADIETDTAIDQTKWLKTGGSGAAQILYHPEYTGEQWGVVRLSNKQAGIKLVQPQNTMYAAFGGDGTAMDYGGVYANALAISTGNYVADNADGTGTRQRRVVYDATCRVWDFDSSGNLIETDEYLEAYNPGSLPIGTDSFVFVQKHAGRWVAMRPLSSHVTNCVQFRIANNAGGASTVTAASGDVRFLPEGLTITATGDAQADTYNFCHARGDDIFIHHPGTYKITYGCAYYKTGDWSRTITDSGGDTFSTEYDGRLEINLIQNFDTSLGNLSTQWGSVAGTPPFWTQQPISSDNLFSAYTERVGMLNHTLDNSHGQPYMRLNLAFELTGPSGGTPEAGVFVGEAFITIEAAGVGGYGGNEGTGYNAFLGTDGAFQWWGGGTEPNTFDEYGVP